MPLYEYQCPQCGEIFERLKPMSASEEPEPCPACSNPDSQRILSAFATANAATSTGSGGCGPSAFS